MSKRPAWLDPCLDVLNSIPEGHQFITADLGGMLMTRRLCRNPSTAWVYAGKAIRHLLDVQQDCPEQPQLIKAGRYYLFVEASE